MADVAQAQQCSVGLGAQHDVLELPGVHQAAGRVHRILEIGPGRSRRLSEGARRILPVLRLDGRADVGRGDAELGHLVRVHPHAHGVNLVRAEARFAHAFEIADLVHQVDLRVVGEEQRIVAVVAGNQADGEQEGARYLLHGHALLLHLRRQPRHGDAHAVLRLHGGDVRVGAQLERHLNVQCAVVGAGGKVVEHAVETDQLLFDGLRHGFLEVLRVAAEEVRGDLHHRRHHFRIRRHREIGDGHRAEYHHHDGDHHREDGMIDKESRHRSASRLRLVIRPRLDGCAGPHLQLPFHDDALAGFEAAARRSRARRCDCR